MYPLAASRSQNRPPAKSGADAQWGRPRPYGYLHLVWDLPILYCSPSLTLCCVHTIFPGSGAAIRFLPVTPHLFGFVARARESAPSLRQ
jgi:hypothetical protein